MRWPPCCWPSTTRKLVSTCARRVVRARPGAGCNCWRRPAAKGKCGAPAEQPEEIGLSVFYDVSGSTVEVQNEGSASFRGQGRLVPVSARGGGTGCRYHSPRQTRWRAHRV